MFVFVEDVATFSRLAYDIQQYFNYNEMQYFSPAWAFIVTWDSVAQWQNVPSLVSEFYELVCHGLTYQADDRTLKLDSRYVMC